MKNAIKTWLLLLFLACFITSAVQAGKKEVLQGRTLTGVVLDEQGLPAIGANVLVKGTTIGVATDADGKYRIEVPRGNQTIVFSYVGYRTREITYKGQASLNVSLEPDSEILDDVVVVGYGVQKKVNLTGAVGSVEGDKLACRASCWDSAFICYDICKNLCNIRRCLQFVAKKAIHRIASTIVIEGFNIHSKKIFAI